LDMPVSKTGVVLYHPPVFRVTTEPGTFRAQEFVRSEATGPAGDLFPAVGPSTFLVSELTSENAAPRVEVSYQKDRRGGVR